MSTVNTREEGRNYFYKGYWRLKEAYKCKLTFRNSMDAGKTIYFGKTAAGDFMNDTSGAFVYATYNAAIPAKAEISHTVGGVKWNFANLWKEGTIDRFYSQEITAAVGRNDATWTAVYSQYGTPSTHVFFELRSDNLPIGWILRKEPYAALGRRERRCSLPGQRRDLSAARRHVLGGLSAIAV